MSHWPYDMDGPGQDGGRGRVKALCAVVISRLLFSSAGHVALCPTWGIGAHVMGGRCPLAHVVVGAGPH